MKYEKKHHIIFVERAKEAGFEVEHYHGRNFWEGPAVRVRDSYEAQELIRATSMRLQSDNMGLGFIYYPVG